MLGRLVHSADFERLRAVPAWSRSAHFSVYHVSASPALTARALRHRTPANLSTDGSEQLAVPVDSSPAGHWLGTVLPKRLARRAVTRNLLRRQIRAAMARHQPRLPAGLWVVRLRAPFDKKAFPSAASTPLRQAAGAELDRLLGTGHAGRAGQP